MREGDVISYQCENSGPGGTVEPLHKTPRKIFEL